MALCDPESRGKDVVDLVIEYPARILPEDVAVIELPGAMAATGVERERAWCVINEEADGCILVSELERPVSGSTVKFLHELREAVPHVILVLTKMDELAKSDAAFSEAIRMGKGEAWERVEQARRIGTRRFAREVGRDPATVLSVALAAEQALREGEASEPARRKFESDVERILTLLRGERALILGARSAKIIRRCIGEVAEAEARAAEVCERRIQALEAQRLPDPERFRAQQMDLAEPELAAATERVAARALAVLREGADLVRVECAQRIAACKNKEELRAAIPELRTCMTKGLATAREGARVELERDADRAVRELETRTLQALRERYQLLHEVTRESKRPLRIDATLPDPKEPTELAARIDAAIGSFYRFRAGFGAGGAAMGAVIGTKILPGIGTAAGALVGGFFTFGRTRASLERDCVEAAGACVAELEGPLADGIRAAQPAILSAIRAALHRSLAEAATRFARWIAEPIEAEREAIERERRKQRDLEVLHDRLMAHDATLEVLGKAATDASMGLCR
jgi:hypothetical protein